MLRKTFDFFIFSNLFIAVCAAVMNFQTRQFFSNGRSNTALLYFIISATLFSYNLHWYLTRPVPGTSRRGDWTLMNKPLIFTFMLSGLVGLLWFFQPLKEHWITLGFAGFVTMIYTAPKLPLFRFLHGFAVGKTFFLTIVWVYVTTLLYFHVNELHFTPGFFFFTLSRFFLIYSICILFDYRDKDEDIQQGVTSLPVMVSGKTLKYIFYSSLVISVFSSMQLIHHGFSIFSVVAMIIPAVICGLLYPRAIKDFSDYLYYFVLDGLMMLSPLLTLLFPF